MINFEQIADGLNVSYFDKNGDIAFKTIELSDTEKFEWVKNRSGEFKTWDNIKVSKKPKKYLSKYRMMEILNELNDGDIFETNVPKKYFINIKTELLNEKPTIKNPSSKILSISIFSVSTNTITVLGLKELNNIVSANIKKEINDYCDSGSEIKFQYRMFESEFKMLYAFFGIFCDKMPLISGWGISAFDWPYLIERAKKLNVDFESSSPTHSMNGYLPMHRLVIDYITLFENWDSSIKVKENLQLDWVASTVIGKGKIKNKVPQMQLYSNDFSKFILHCAISTLLVKLIDDKFNLIYPFLVLADISRVSYYDSFSFIHMIESHCVRQAKIKNMVILPSKKAHESYQGAYIMEPIKGIHDYVSVFDCRSMYTSIILQWNISPDSKCSDNSTNCIETINGFKFDKDNPGIFKQFIQDIYDKRTVTTKSILDCKHDIDFLKNYIKNK